MPVTVRPGSHGGCGTPKLPKSRADRWLVDGLVAGHEIRHAPHVGATLDVVLAAQGEHASTHPSDAGGEKAKVDKRTDGVHALGQLREAQAVDEEHRPPGQKVGGRGEGFGLDAGQPGVHHRVASEQVRPQPIKAGGPFVQVGLVDRWPVQQRAGQGVQEGDVPAGGQLEMHCRHAGELGPPRVDHDEGGAPEGRPEDPCADNRVRLCGVGASHDDGACQFDVVEAGAGGTGPRGVPQRGRGRRVADTGAAVDVVRADDRPGQLLEQVARLVGRPRRGQGAERVRTVLGAQRREALGEPGDRRLPGDRSQLARATAEERLGDPVGGRLPSVGVAPLEAEVTAVHDGVGDTSHAGDPSAGDRHLYAAADPAVPTGRDRYASGRSPVKPVAISDRAGGARVDTCPARHAVAVGESLAGTSDELRARTAPLDAVDEAPLDLLACAHAAAARDAGIGPEPQVRMAVVDRARAPSAAGSGLDPQAAGEDGDLAAAGKCAARMSCDLEGEDVAAQGTQRRRVGDHLGAVGERRVTRGLWPGRAGHLHQAQAAASLGVRVPPGGRASGCRCRPDRPR